MTVTDSSAAGVETPPPPPPATITFEGKHGKNPLAEASFGALCMRLPAILAHTARRAWAVDRAGAVLLLVCQLLTGTAAALVLAFTARAMTHLLAAGPVSERLHAALPALTVVAAAAGFGRVSSALSSYADSRITPLLTTEADLSLVSAVCRVEASAYGEDGFADRQEAAEVGVTRTRTMVQDAQRFMAALIRMIAATGVITALHWMMLPLLLLAVLPAGIGAVLSARVDYETHYNNVADRNVRSMMRWWATYSRYGDEVRANGMTGYLIHWYRALSDRIDRRTLTAAPRMLRIVLATSALGGVFLLGTWAALAWLAVTGRVALPVAATAVVAVQTALAALSQFVVHGAAMFHTSLYLADMRSFLDMADERAPSAVRRPCPTGWTRSGSTRSSTGTPAGTNPPSRAYRSPCGAARSWRSSVRTARASRPWPSSSRGSSWPTRAASCGTAPISPTPIPKPCGDAPPSSRRTSPAGRCAPGRTSPSAGPGRTTTDRCGKPSTPWACARRWRSFPRGSTPSWPGNSGAEPSCPAASGSGSRVRGRCTGALPC